MAAAPFDTSRPVLQSFLSARLIVLAAYGCTRLIGPAFHQRTETLLGWDAAWYHRVAETGYGSLPSESLRFFPLLPLLARALGFLLFSDGAALLLIANACAYGYAALGHRMALAAGLPERSARLVPWVIGFAPTGFVLVMGYSEALYGILIVVTLLAIRARRWGVAAAAGFLAGALRPTGVLLALPILVEAVRGLRTARLRSWAARAVAVASPVLGMAGYLGWVAWRFGDALLPFRVQTRSDLRAGVLVDPLPSIGHAVLVLVGQRSGSVSPLVHLCWAVLATVLLVRCARRMPASWTAFSAATMFLALTARGLTSFERYTASAIPLLLVAAEWLADRPARRRVQVLALAGVVLFGYSFAAFLHTYIP